MKNIFIYKAVFSLLFIPSISFTQTTLSDATFFNTPTPLVDARDASMAHSTVAEAYNVNAMYSNPAALIYIKKLSWALNHSQEKNINGMSEGLAMPIKISKNDVIGLGATVSHTGYSKKNTPEVFKVIQYGYNIAYARELLPSLSIGTDVGVRYARTKNLSVWSVRSSIGVFYFPSEEISYGVSYNGIGNGLGYVYDGTDLHIYSTKPPRILHAGLALRLPSGSGKKSFTCIVSNEKTFRQKGIIYKGGIEYIFLNSFATRIGYFVKNEVNYATFGCGIEFGPANLDFSISPSKRSNRSVFLSLGVSL